MRNKVKKKSSFLLCVVVLINALLVLSPAKASDVTEQVTHIDFEDMDNISDMFSLRADQTVENWTDYVKVDTTTEGEKALHLTSDYTSANLYVYLTGGWNAGTRPTEVQYRFKIVDASSPENSANPAYMFRPIAHTEKVVSTYNWCPAIYTQVVHAKKQGQLLPKQEDANRCSLTYSSESSTNFDVTDSEATAQWYQMKCTYDWSLYNESNSYQLTLNIIITDVITGETYYDTTVICKEGAKYAYMAGISSKTLSFGFSTGKMAGLDTWIDDIYIWSENFSTGETYGPAGDPSLSFMETYQDLIDIAAEFSLETDYANLTENEKTAFKSQIYAFLTDYDALDENAKGNSEVATAYSNIRSMLGKIVQQETGIDDESFQIQYAETLALDVERLAPYDMPEVDAMLAVYEEFENVAEYALSIETVAKVTALREARNAWDTTSDATIAASYEKIWGDKLTTEPNAAWNVYNRLTANQKELLADEEMYPGLVSRLYAAMQDQTQVKDDAISVYCVGDSLTHGVGSDDTTTESYPAQLQTKLATYDSLYTVSKFAVANSHVYKWAVEEGATENTALTETTQWALSHEGDADIVILQLGTFDLDNVLALGEAGEKQYLETYESIVQSYLRLENSPYVIISNTPVNYSNIDSTVAELNMQIADKYGLPCVDMYAYTSTYSDEEVKTYYRSNKYNLSTEGYEVMAQVFCDAITCLTTEFDTADVTGYSFDESYLNSFLTPELYSATIKNETDPAKQGLGFETFFSKYYRTGSDIVAYGTIFSRYKSSGDYSNMTLENVGNGNYFKATISTSDDSGLSETSYITGINCYSNADFKKAYIARSYVVYEDEQGNQTVYYSINTRTDKLPTEDDVKNAHKNRVGVVSGYATRSLISVAKSMIKTLAEQGITDSNVATYDETTDTLTVLPTATENNAAAIFKLLYENKHRLKAVYLSTNGDDTNAGTKDAPYATLNKALASVPNDGTIIIADNYVVASDFEWEERSKNVTITGATSDVSLDFTAMSTNIVMGNDVTFDDITLTLDTSDNLFANGHKLVVEEGVTTPNLINVYGGGKGGTTVASTNVILLSGSYQNIYGGSYYGTVTGDTWLTVGGNVNPGDSVAVHDGNTGQRIYAGGNNDTIGGNTHCTFESNAQAYQLFGGSVGANAQIAGVSNIEFNSGVVYAIIGGNNESSTISGTNVTVNGGTIAQIFGANQNASMGSAASKATVNLELLGGTITRRVYGGCYNEVSLFGSWDNSYHVTGNINLTISGNAILSLNQETDNGFYVCSRYKEAFAEEECTIKYYNLAGYTNYQAKKGNGLYMSSVSPHDEEVYLY